MKPPAELLFDLSTPLPPIAKENDLSMKYHKVDLIAISARAAEQR
jgi:hypothetical protein